MQPKVVLCLAHTLLKVSLPPPSLSLPTPMYVCESIQMYVCRGSELKLSVLLYYYCSSLCKKTVSPAL